MNKTTKKATGKTTKNDIYVVSWAEYDDNNNSMTSGTFMDIYSSYEKARKAVDECIDETVRDDMFSFDEDEYEDVYGAATFEDIRRKFIAEDRHDYIKVVNCSTSVECQYIITHYSTKYVK